MYSPITKGSAYDLVTAVKRPSSRMAQRTRIKNRLTTMEKIREIE